jgi:hypothetical protein
MISLRLSQICGVILMFGAGAVWAETLGTSPRPLVNPRQTDVAAPNATAPERADQNPSLFRDGLKDTSLALSRRPLVRPADLDVRVKPSTSAPVTSLPVKGQLCGIAGLEGKTIPPIGGGGGCGLADGVEVTAVAGIKLSIPAKIDCDTAKALKSWVDNGIIPAIGDLGGGVKRLEIAGSFVCRPRNHQKGAKISEHGRGKAVDLAGVMLRNGRVLTVTKDWKRTPKVMREIHRSACGTFGTVLGPESDKYHFDHFHVDTARYNNGAYCR